jgi:hypothetical protein
MSSVHSSLGLAKLSTDEIEDICISLSEGFCEYCGISTGVRTLFWDGLVAMIEKYKGVDFSEALDIATEYVARINPECNQYDTSMAFGNWYYIFRNNIREECQGKYNTSIDFAMRAMKYPTWKLYIDDIRTPDDESYVVVRSVEEAKSLILIYGVPLFISFDHDLGVDENGILLPSGYDLAKWIVEQDMDKKSDVHLFSVFDFEVHSMNPVGAKNICSFLSSYLKYKEEEGNWYGY